MVKILRKIEYNSVWALRDAITNDKLAKRLGKVGCPCFHPNTIKGILRKLTTGFSGTNDDYLDFPRANTE